MRPAVMQGPPRPPPASTPSPWSVEPQVQLLPKEPLCIISEIGFNPHTHPVVSPSIIIPICQMRTLRLKEVTGLEPGLPPGSSRGQVRAVFMVGDRELSESQEETLWGYRGRGLLPAAARSLALGEGGVPTPCSPSALLPSLLILSHLCPPSPGFLVPVRFAPSCGLSRPCPLGPWPAQLSDPGPAASGG